MSKNQPPGWVIIASMEDIQAKHPDWTEDERRAEFDRLGFEWARNRIAEDRLAREARAAKRAAKCVS